MLDSVIDALACYRLTRLVIDDKLTEPLRDAISFRMQRDAPMICPQCHIERCDPLHLEECPNCQTAARPVEREHAVTYFIACPWCTSFWIGFGIVAARTIAPRSWSKVSTALALSAVAGIIDRKIGA